MIVVELIYNLSILVALSVLSGILDSRFDKSEISGKVFQGLLFGITLIISTAYPLMLIQGITFTGSSIIISLCTLVFGPLAGIISAAMSIVFRILLGGDGTSMESLVIISSFLVGYLFYRRINSSDKYIISKRQLYLLGIVVNLILLIYVFAFLSNLIIPEFEAVSFVVIGIFPLMTLFIGFLLVEHEKNKVTVKTINRKANLFKSAFYSIGDAVIGTNKSGIVLQMNKAAEELTNWSESKAAGHHIDEIFRSLIDNKEDSKENTINQFIENSITPGFKYHTIIITKNGEKIPISFRSTPLKDKNNEILGVVIVFRNQSDEKNIIQELAESEQRFRKLYEDTPIANQSLDESANILNVNKAWMELLGYKKNEVVEHSIREFLDPESISVFEKSFSNCLKEGELCGIELKFVKKNGEKILVSSTGRTVFDKNRNSLITYCVLNNITEQKITEDALRKSEEQFRNFIQLAPDAFFQGDINGNFIKVNNAAIKLTGYSELELLKMNMSDLFIEQSLLKNPLRYDLLEKGETIKSERFLKRKDGTNIPIEMSSKKLPDNSYQSFLRDISEHKKADEAIKNSEEKYRLIAENTVDIIAVFDLRLNYKYVSPSVKKLLGYSVDEMLNLNLDNILTAESVTKINRIFAAEMELENSGRADPLRNRIVELEGFRKDRTTIWMEVNVAFIRDENEKPTGILSVARDISERKKAELALKESEELFRTLAASTTATIFVFRGDNFVFVNNASEELTGYSKDELLNKNFWDIVHPDYRELIKERGYARQQGRQVPNRYEFKIIRKDGKEIWVDFAGGKLFWKGLPAAIGSVVDITDRKIAEEELMHSRDRMQLLVEGTPHLFFYVQDLKGNIEYVSPSVEQITGRSVNEWLRQNHWFTTDSKTNELARKRTRNNLLGEVDTTSFIVETLHSSGSIVFLEVFEKPLIRNNEVIGLHGVAHDITNRLTMENALKQSEEKYRAISSLTSDYLFSTHIDEKGNSKFSWAAGSFKKITGYTFDEYVRIGGWHATLHPDDIEKDKIAFEKIMKNQKVSIEVRTYHKNGSIVWVRSFGYPIWDEEKNRLTGIVGAVQDISEEMYNRTLQNVQYNIANAVAKTKSLDELLVRVKEELSRLIDTTNFYIAFYDENTDMLHSHVQSDSKDDIETWKSERSMTGLIIKANNTLLVKRDDIQELINTKVIDQIGTIPEIWLGVPLRHDNKVIGAMVVQDYEMPDAYNEKNVNVFEMIANQLSLYIERKKAEEDANRLSRAIIQSPVSIIITDPDGNIVYVNPKFSSVSGYGYDEIIGKNSSILKSGNHTKEFYNDLWKTISSGKDWHGEINNRKKNGELYWENVIISPIVNEDKNITYFVGVKEDITEKKKMLEEIIYAKEKAEASEKIKSEFLAQMSHEIRSPLNIILNFVGLIKDELKSHITKDLEIGFASMDSASRRIIRTIDLILNMSDLQLGTYEMVLRHFDVQESLERIVAEYQHTASMKSLKLTLSSKLNSEKLLTDEYAFNQILSNLLDNAIKYTDVGVISIDAKKENNKLVISVEDTGIGISNEFLPSLFTSFTQEEHGYSRSYDGNGLGLALVKKYCEIIDAEIVVQSEKGKGSIFSVKFKQ